MPVPYVAYSNETLSKQPELEAGMTIECPEHCGSRHVLWASEPPGVLCYHCGEKMFLAAVGGRSILRVKPDASSSSSEEKQR